MHSAERLFAGVAGDGGWTVAELGPPLNEVRVRTENVGRRRNCGRLMELRCSREDSGVRVCPSHPATYLSVFIVDQRSTTSVGAPLDGRNGRAVH